MNNHLSWHTIHKLIARHPNHQMILLESQMDVHPSSNLSYLAVGSVRSIEARGESVKVHHGGKCTRYESNPWEALKRFRRESSGKIFGYLGYDLKNFTEELSSNNKEICDMPDLWFVEPEYLYIIDKNGTVQGTDPKLSDLPGTDAGIEPRSLDFRISDLTPMLEKSEYLDHIDQIRDLIREGHFYELNYSYPMRTAFDGDPLNLYEKMRKVSPVPFASFIRAESFSVCCLSPERFLQKKGVQVKSEPIKGTAARSEDPKIDQRNREKLLNEKNRAENLMIVDLVRHDLSALSLTGSVRVDKLFETHSFETVHQLVSVITAEVRTETDPVDIIRSCFPMGSMTGAPKIEVMKRIDELEIYRRGLYSGAIGWMDVKGDFDFNVVIRTAIIQGRELIFPVGGAITSDSDPEEEWHETLVKARALTAVM